GRGRGAEMGSESGPDGLRQTVAVSTSAGQVQCCDESDDARFDQDEFFGIRGGGIGGVSFMASPCATIPRPADPSLVCDGGERGQILDLRLKGVITTVNVEGPGPFKLFMKTCRSKIVAVQEHRTPIRN
ncbi:unnamed protein product, partial [Prorocentrum cordatum]